MSASYPPRRLFDGDIDLSRERSQDYTRVNPRRRRKRRGGGDALITLMAVFACLAGGIGLGVWAADVSQPDVRSGETVRSTPPPVEAAPAGLPAVAAPVPPSEAQRAVARRLAGLAFDRAARQVQSGVATSLEATRPDPADARSTPTRASGSSQDGTTSPSDRDDARERGRRWGVQTSSGNDYDFSRPFDLRDQADDDADELLRIEQVDPYER